MTIKISIECFNRFPPEDEYEHDEPEEIQNELEEVYPDHFERKDVILSDDNDPRVGTFIYPEHMVGEHDRRATKELSPRWGKAFIKAPDIQCATLIVGIAKFEMGCFTCVNSPVDHVYCTCAYEHNLIDYDYTFLDFWQDISRLSKQRDALKPQIVKHIRLRMRRLRTWYLLPVLKQKYRRVYKRNMGHEIEDSSLDQLVKYHVYL